MASKGKYIYTIGRRKTATATVRLYNDKGESLINEKKVTEYLDTPTLESKLYEPFRVTGLDKNEFYFTAKVSGGGFNAQMEAIRLGLARAIISFDEDKKAALKEKGLTTRDPRMVERKKTGLRKARKKEQFSKR